MTVLREEAANGLAEEKMSDAEQGLRAPRRLSWRSVEALPVIDAGWTGLRQPPPASDEDAAWKYQGALGSMISQPV
jgi:hypothetical protein